MKDLTDFIYENAIDETTVITMGDSGALATWLKTNIEGLEGTLKVTGDGVKVNNRLVPGTALSKKMTASQIADAIVSFVNADADVQASRKVKVKKTRKNAGVPRGNYGAKERMDARAAERNANIVKGYREPDNYDR